VRDAEPFQKSRNHLKILSTRRFTRSQFHNEDTKILHTTLKI